MTPQAKMARRLEKRGAHYENKNYHEAAGTLYDLAKEVAKGKFNIETLAGSVLAPDAEKVLLWIERRSWA